MDPNSCLLSNPGYMSLTSLLQTTRQHIIEFLGNRTLFDKDPELVQLEVPLKSINCHRKSIFNAVSEPHGVFYLALVY